MNKNLCNCTKIIDCMCQNLQLSLENSKLNINLSLLNPTIMTTPQPIAAQQPQLIHSHPILPQTTLSTKNLFSHFFLIHDFLFRMVKSPSNNAEFFDLQIDVNESMRKAAKIGGKLGQGGMFAGLLVYCMKGRSIKLKLFSGFLYMYWIEHFYTLGSYTGILLRMPSIYNKVGQHFLTQEPINEHNLFIRLNHQMHANYEQEDIQQALNRVFKQEVLQEKSYLVNQFFAKNKDKYFTHDEGTLVEKPNMKLKYADCFLTRYIYYTFNRWYHKKLDSWGIVKNDF